MVLKRALKLLVPERLKDQIKRLLSPAIRFMDDDESWNSLIQPQEVSSHFTYEGRRKIPDSLHWLKSRPQNHDQSPIVLADETLTQGQRRAFFQAESVQLTTSNRLRFRPDLLPAINGGDITLSPADHRKDYNFKLLCPKLNLLFNEIPKNVSSTIKSVLFSIQQEGRVNQSYQRWVSHERWPHQFPEMVVDWDQLAWPSYFRFAFLRNPYERILSGYLNSGWKFHYEGIPFKEFVESLPEIIANPDCDLIEIHYHPFSTFVPKVRGNYYLDFLGKCENFENDFNEILHSAGVKNTLKFPVINKSEHGSYRDFYDDVSRRTVERLYGEEIDLGKYTF